MDLHPQALSASEGSHGFLPSPWLRVRLTRLACFPLQTPSSSYSLAPNSPLADSSTGHPRLALEADGQVSAAAL